MKDDVGGDAGDAAKAPPPKDDEYANPDDGSLLGPLALTLVMLAAGGVGYLRWKKKQAGAAATPAEGLGQTTRGEQTMFGSRQSRFGTDPGTDPGSGPGGGGKGRGGLFGALKAKAGALGALLKRGPKVGGATASGAAKATAGNAFSGAAGEGTRTGAAPLSRVGDVADTLIRRAAETKRPAAATPPSGEATRASAPAANEATRPGAPGAEPCSFERFVEIQCAQAAWAEQGQDVGARLKATFGLSLIEWSNANAYWSRRYLADVKLLKEYNQLEPKYKAKYGMTAA
jgi:hypothetical protein